MTKFDDIKKAISALPPAELAKFREWFESFAADMFDQQIERDAAGGRLDRLAAEAEDEVKAGRTRDL